MRSACARSRDPRSPRRGRWPRARAASRHGGGAVAEPGLPARRSGCFLLLVIEMGSSVKDGRPSPGLSARRAPRPEESPAKRTLVSAAQPIPRARLALLQARAPTLLPICRPSPSLLRPRLSRLAPATAPAAPARTRRRTEAFDQPRLARPSQPAPPRRCPSPSSALLLLISGRAEPLGARSQRLGQRVLQRRRALDELELAQLPLRLLRPERAHDGGQAAAGPLGPGALGPGLRLSFARASSCRRRSWAWRPSRWSTT